MTAEIVDTGSVRVRSQRSAIAPAGVVERRNANRSPVYQNGSNNRAGGPANELISATGGVPRQDLGAAGQGRVPSYQRGSNQRAGGPANELISETGGVPLRSRSVAERQGIPAYQLGSNSQAGGPANELISPTGR